MLTRTLLTRIILVILVVAIVFLALLAAGTRVSTSLPVLNVAIKAGDTITTNEVVFLSWPASGIGPTTLTTKDQLVGKKAAVAIGPNEPIKADELGTLANSSAATRPDIDPHFPYANAADLLKQKLPVFPGLNQTSGGLIQPGDYVNLLLVPGGTNLPSFILQKIHVIAARSNSGQDIEAGASGGGGGGGSGGGGLLSTPTNGAKASLIAVYILSVTQEQAVQIAQYSPTSIYYLYATPTDPDLSGVPSGLSPAGAATSPNPLATPTPSILPTSSPTSSPAVTPAPAVTPSTKPTASP